MSGSDCLLRRVLSSFYGGGRAQHKESEAPPATKALPVFTPEALARMSKVCSR